MSDRRTPLFGSPGAAALMIALSGVLMGCGPNSPADRSASDPTTETAAGTEPKTSVQVVDLAGLESVLEAQEGHALLLNFWAIWCIPCVQELPELDQIARRWSPKGARVLTVNYDLMVGGTSDSATEAVRAFLDKHGYSFGAMILDEPDYDAINARLDLPGPVPVTLAIDAEGNIVDRQEGKADAARFEEMMRHAVGED